MFVKGCNTMVSSYLRINKKEEEKLKKLSKNVNMQRIELEMTVLKESEVLHKLIDEAFKKAKVEKGHILID